MKLDILKSNSFNAAGYFVGPSNDAPESDDMWISPIEVEDCLINHPAVLECAAAPGWNGEKLVKPCAYIVLTKGFSPSEKLEKEIKAHLKTELAHYKFSWRVYFVDELPKTPTGKLKRFQLKDLEHRKIVTS